MSKKDQIVNELSAFSQSSDLLNNAGAIVCKLGASDEFTICMKAFLKNITRENHYRYIHADLSKYIRKSIYKKLHARLDIANKPNARYRQIEELIEILHNHIKVHNRMIDAQLKAGFDVMTTEPTFGFIGGDLSYFLSESTAKNFKTVIETCKKEQLQSTSGGLPLVYKLDINLQRFVDKKRTVMEKVKFLAFHVFKFNFLNVSNEYTNGFKVSIDFKADKIIINTNRADGKTFKKEAEILPIFSDKISESIRITEQDIIEIIEFDID